MHLPAKQRLYTELTITEHKPHSPPSLRPRDGERLDVLDEEDGSRDAVARAKEVVDQGLRDERVGVIGECYLGWGRRRVGRVGDMWTRSSSRAAHDRVKW
ncbi:hypothetical protein Ct61P_05424 [Colletotrichum tofieldiae]|nr:hypothetical protein Ct61P_05424 [Colletotrichum tofieldiae]